LLKGFVPAQSFEGTYAVVRIRDGALWGSSSSDVTESVDEATPNFSIAIDSLGD
jgi:predicted secreted Zn-dependent protease